MNCIKWQRTALLTGIFLSCSGAAWSNAATSLEVQFSAEHTDISKKIRNLYRSEMEEASFLSPGGVTSIGIDLADLDGNGKRKFLPIFPGIPTSVGLSVATCSSSGMVY